MGQDEVGEGGMSKLRERGIKRSGNVCIGAPGVGSLVILNMSPPNGLLSKGLRKFL